MPDDGRATEQAVPDPPSSPAPVGTSTGKRHHHHLHTGTIVAGAAVLLALGLVVGAVVAPSPEPPIFGSTTTTTGQGGSNSLAPGSPANSAALARVTGPTLVDINVTDAYQAVQGAGTGMVLTPSGVVLTNNHVIEGETSLSVRDIGNGKTYGATVLGYDRSHDVAVLRLTNASRLQTITVGASDLVAVGDGAVAVGNAQGAGGTPSHAGGKITALEQTISAQDQVSGTSEKLTGLFETNANIVPGYSGGALVNVSARVIGMVTAASQAYQFGSNATQGYAVPIATAREIAAQIVSGHRSATVHIGPTPFLGVQVTTPSDGSEGALIANVVSDGPAHRAGLSSGDTITALNGTTVTSPEELTAALLELTPASTVTVHYLDQSGQPLTVEVTLGTGPPQ
jgi:S1-C subfamily serine protease